jgi:hypothetical protein
VIAVLLLALAPQDVLRLEAAGTRVERDARVEVAGPIADPEGTGVLVIESEGVTVDFGGALLSGAADGRAADAFAGVGIVVRAKGVTLRGARVAGYRVGILAQQADGLVLEDCDVSGNFRQRLLSTPEAENAADWLWPHHNDDKQWRTNYGAGICIESSAGVTVRRCRARDGQNGLILDRVTGSQVHDNDFSFLSGWGIAMWRSSGNTISRNALDFCVRGYSHGVYNRGQDSAGLLMFEQCSDNAILENSITHGGDGVFGFAGKEALGEAPGPEGFSVERAGCNDNLFADNDLSFAAAHGLEMTFSFGNRVFGNRFESNAICGIWGGYSRDLFVADNDFVSNGGSGYGAERGGVNIEHGQGNKVVMNRFDRNACGVRLWWDPDEALLETPWVSTNGAECTGNTISFNRFQGDAVGFELKGCSKTFSIDNQFDEVAREQVRDGEEFVDEFFGVGGGVAHAFPELPWTVREFEALGGTHPVGARAHLAGRENILMTEWGPYDWERPLLTRVGREGRGDLWRWLGLETLRELECRGSGVRAEVVEREGGVYVLVRGEREGALVPYSLRAVSASGEQTHAGLLADVRWSVRVFSWTADPREDETLWRAQAEGAAAFELDGLDLAYGMGGPGGVAGVPEAVVAAALPADRFGTLAETRVSLPAGRWKVTVTSDDGVRVRLDGEVLLEDWTWHAPRTGAEVFELAEAREVQLAVEHFELDGFAVLKVALEPAE